MSSIDSKKWQERLTGVANLIAGWSKDETKVGCVIVNDDCEVLATGYNGFPRGVNDDVKERNERPEKYLWVAHAETNAIAQAAKRGTALEGGTLILSNLYEHVTMPCNDCAIKIVQAGIKRVVCQPLMGGVNSIWDDRAKVTVQIFNEAGVEIVYR